jgi:Xaa-Pro aminopeptidase
MPDYLEARQQRLANLPLGDAILLVGAGHPIPLPEGSDQTYAFRSHADYFYFTGHECAGGIVALDPQEKSAGQWSSFVPAITEGERVWEGRAQVPGRLMSEFEPWLQARRGRPVALLGAAISGIDVDAALSARIREVFLHARRPKDAQEITQLRKAVTATSAGFEYLRQHIRPGITERALQIELEAEFFRHGGTRTGYSTIVGSGPNSAVLHFEPTPRAVQPGEFVLVDAGAEVDRYTADVTRTFIAGTPTPFQRDLYQLVLTVEKEAISRCRPGAEWKSIHLAAATELTAGLVAMGVMRGTPESLVEQEAHTLFFPHGIGHMLGLGVRDASGLFPGRAKDPRPGLRSLRMDLPLAAGYVVTIEPGLYFIPALLNAPARRTRYAEAVNWPLVDQHLALGGVRIEDNVLVTEGAPEVLTAAIPK